MRCARRHLADLEEKLAYYERAMAASVSPAVSGNARLSESCEQDMHIYAAVPFAGGKPYTDGGKFDRAKIQEGWFTIPLKSAGQVAQAHLYLSHSALSPSIPADGQNISGDAPLTNPLAFHTTDWIAGPRGSTCPSSLTSSPRLPSY